jgi:hypothetical protein
MRKIFFLSSLLLLAIVAFSQGTPGNVADSLRADSLKKAAAAQDSVKKVAAKKTADSAKAAKAADTTKHINADSASLAASYEHQSHNPWELYPKPQKDFSLSGIIGFLLVVGVGLYLFNSTTLCRDLSYNPKTNELRPLKDRPYSYSRVQLFWWTLIVLGCYVSFFIYSGNLLALNPTSVLLLGGTLATSIFGRVMDNNQIARDNDNSVEDVPVRHQDIEKTKGLFLDIMSDEGGVTIHRFQAVVFNLVFGIGYIILFLKYVKLELYPLPTFEQWQLTLLGISAAGYLGLKSSENGPETIEKRQVEAIKKNDPAPPAPGSPPSPTPAPSIVTKSATNAPAIPTSTTSSFQEMKENLWRKGKISN